MTKKSSEILIKLARESINLAMKCVSAGETLVPFIMTEGAKGAIITIAGESIEKSILVAQKTILEFDNGTEAFAFAYDGFLTFQGEKVDAIFVESGKVSDDKIFVFAQRYKYSGNKKEAERIGNWVCLEKMEPRLNKDAEQGA
jgi:hypothetical protein